MRYALPLNYSVYLFDLYGTLVNMHTDDDIPVLWKQLARWYDAWGVRYTPLGIRRAARRILKAETRRVAEQYHTDHPEPDFAVVFEALFREKGYEPDEALLAATRRFYRRVSQAYVRTYPGTLELLQDLRRRGKQVYLMSNAQACFTRPELDEMGLTELFHGICISSERHIRKPDPRFFLEYLKEQGIPVKDCIYVGNDARYDVAGPKAVGIQAFYVRSNMTPKGQRAPDADCECLNFTGWKTPED